MLPLLMVRARVLLIVLSDHAPKYLEHFCIASMLGERLLVFPPFKKKIDCPGVPGFFPSIVMRDLKAATSGGTGGGILDPSPLTAIRDSREKVKPYQ